jgi:hypothetical protein
VGDRVSLADDQALAAMAGAIAASGVLIQAQAFDMASLASAFDTTGDLAENDVIEVLRLRSTQDAAIETDALGPFGYAVIADSQDGDTEILTIAIAYAEAAMAESAAAHVAQRLDGFVPASRPGADSVFDEISAVVAEATVQASGNAVAVVTARAERASPGAPPGIMFTHVIDAIYRREFTPLSVLD